MKKEVLDAQNKDIFLQLKKFKDFYLAGGTALALQIRHRISVDFDLFSRKEISRNLLQQVRLAFPKKKIIVSVNNPEELTLFVNGKKITFLHYPFPVLLDLVHYHGVKLLSMREIGVTKAYTIGRRGSYKDYVDLYFIMHEKYSSLDEIIDLASRKYRNEFHSRLFLEQLVYLEDIQDTTVKFLKKKVTKEELKEFFRQAIRKMKW